MRRFGFKDQYSVYDRLWLLVLMAVLVCCGASRTATAQVTNVLQRVPNSTLNMPLVPESFGYKTQLALGGLGFNYPVAVRSPFGETNRVFVVEQAGKIYVITNLTSPTRTVFLDLSRQVLVGPIAGLFALAFHPGFATNGLFFVGYNLNTQTTDGSSPHYRVSRFSVSPDAPTSALTNSELPLITQRYIGNGFCDDMLFGADGYLYIAVADPAQDAGGTPQAIDGNLYGGILRIDVDKSPASLSPNPHPAVTTNYAIPADNPFVGATNFNGKPIDPTKVRTEFYAIGLRNPWRMSLDPLSGLLFVGDPGTSVQDEINVIVKGGNYGWPYREGTGPGPQARGTPTGLQWINPIYQRPAGAIIGGVLYRGQNYPQLQGTYIFGDWVSGQVLGLRYAGTNLVSAQNLVTQSAVEAFGIDPSNGDVLLVTQSPGRVMRLTYSTNLTGAPLPPTLADIGVFADTASLTPNPGIVPYDINVPLWSDNASKTRWFSVPWLTGTIGFNRDGAWSYPVGTIWIKHFELELTNGVPESARRLETRLLVRTSSGVYGATYRWGDSLTNAVLVSEEGLDEAFTIYDHGLMRSQVWHYPSRSECLTCHTPLAGYALGFNTAQLNREFGYPGGTQNQLRAFSDAGFFGTNLHGVYTMPALAPPSDNQISLEYRVRSYLAANCSQCHQPGGAALGRFDARLSTPLSSSSIMKGELVNTLGSPDNRVIKPGSLAQSVLLTRVAALGADHMPPLATSVVNQPAVDLLSAWITSSATNYLSYTDWQQLHFGSTNAPGSAPWQDPDGDGASNALEYLTGTDPLLPGDAWSIGIGKTDLKAVIDFTRIANRGFEVQWTSDIANNNSWQSLDLPANAPLFAATNSAVSMQDPLTNASTKFYRVRVFEP
jgi:uncharacterized repeat protein (TIGR03806 family)